MSKKEIYLQRNTGKKLIGEFSNELGEQFVVMKSSKNSYYLAGDETGWKNMSLRITDLKVCDPKDASDVFILNSEESLKLRNLLKSKGIF